MRPHLGGGKRLLGGGEVCGEDVGGGGRGAELNEKRRGEASCRSLTKQPAVKNLPGLPGTPTLRSERID